MIKRVIVGILAMVVLLAGGALGAVALWARDSFDENGVMSFDVGTITPGPDARSTIIDVDRFGATVPYIGDWGTTRLSVATAERGDPSDTLFIGAAGTTDVDAFVKGSPYSVAIRDGLTWTTREVPGALIPPLPGEQGFWLVQDVGRTPAVVVPDARPLTLLVMHPAGIPSGPLTLSIDFMIPRAPAWTLSLTVASAMLLLLGLVLLVLVFRIRGRRGRHEAASPAAPPEPTVPSEPEPKPQRPMSKELVGPVVVAVKPEVESVDGD